MSNVVAITALADGLAACGAMGLITNFGSCIYMYKRTAHMIMSSVRISHAGISQYHRVVFGVEITRSLSWQTNHSIVM